MAWETTAPAVIIQLRTQLGSSATWTTLVGAGNVSSRVHFPSFNPAGVRDTADAIPAVLLMRPQAGRRKWIEGAAGLMSGSLAMMFYFPAITVGAVTGYSAGQIEQLIETICGELIAQTSGIPFRDEATIEEASDPTGGEIAANTEADPTAYRSCLATIPYGYSP